MNELLNRSPELESQSNFVEVVFIPNEAGEIEFAPDTEPSVAAYVEAIKAPTLIEFNTVFGIDDSNTTSQAI